MYSTAGRGRGRGGGDGECSVYEQKATEGKEYVFLAQLDPNEQNPSINTTWGDKIRRRKAITLYDEPANERTKDEDEDEDEGEDEDEEEEVEEEKEGDKDEKEEWEQQEDEEDGPQESDEPRKKKEGKNEHIGTHRRGGRKSRYRDQRKTL